MAPLRARLEPGPVGVSPRRPGRRAGAYLIDAAFATLLAAVLTRLAGSQFFTGGLYVLMWLIAWTAVRVACPLIAGESPGRLLAGLRTVGPGGGEPGATRRLMREVMLYPLGIVPLARPAAVQGAARPLGRSVGDRLAGTQVVGGDRAGCSGRLLALCAGFVVLAAGIGTAALYERVPAGDRQRSDFVDGCTSEGGAAGGCECIFDRLHQSLGGQRIDEISRGGVDRLPPDAVAALDEAAARCDAPAAGAVGLSA